MNIEIIPAYDRPEEVRRLFREYTDLLTAGDATFREYLKLQNYDQELSHLEEKYGYPDGRLYLALADGQVAGCIALRRLDEKRCEMKRLYVRPRFQGLGIGRMLAQLVIREARSIGYDTILLDTFPFLQRAIAMYRHMGFREMEQYNNSPMDHAIYLYLEL